MKAKELSVGYWVYFKKNKIYAQITEIYKTLDAEPKRMVALASSKGERYCVSIDEIEPISLKKIHLTKNRFRVINDGDTRFVFNDGYQIMVEFAGNQDDPIICLSINFADKELWMEIEYVHQLQLAMYLLGVEKEIKL